MTISVGVAEVNTRPQSRAHRGDISETLALADEQLYEAKHQGRNRVCYASIKPDNIAPQVAS